LSLRPFTAPLILFSIAQVVSLSRLPLFVGLPAYFFVEESFFLFFRSGSREGSRPLTTRLRGADEPFAKGIRLPLFPSALICAFSLAKVILGRVTSPFAFQCLSPALRGYLLILSFFPVVVSLLPISAPCPLQTLGFFWPAPGVFPGFLPALDFFFNACVEVIPLSCHVFFHVCLADFIC